MTFKACADAYIKANRSGWKNDKHAAQWGATFNETRRGNRIFPAATAIINDLPIAAIDTGLVRKVLEPIWYTTPETASRVRGRIERVLAWATVAGYRTGDNPARWTGHLKELLPPKAKVAAVTHHGALAYRDMPAFMARLRAKQGTSACALEFTILTAARTGEAIGAKWAEIDLGAKLWTDPGGAHEGREGTPRPAVRPRHRHPRGAAARGRLRVLGRSEGSSHCRIWRCSSSSAACAKASPSTA